MDSIIGIFCRYVKDCLTTPDSAQDIIRELAQFGSQRFLYYII